jgi:anti-sigma B factor antagonist
MDIKAREIDSVVVLDLKGPLTLAEDTRKLHCLLDLLLRENQRYFVFNLQNVERMDCAGIGELILSYRKVREKGGDLKLLNLDQRLHHLLKMMGLLTVIEVFENERDAISSFPFRATLAPTTVPGEVPLASSETTTDQRDLSNTLAASGNSPTYPSQVAV